MNQPPKKPGKVEHDVWGAISVLGEWLGKGNPAVEEAAATARRYAGMIPEREETPEALELTFCAACDAHHAKGQHISTVAEQSAERATVAGPDFYCVFDANRVFVRPFVSANSAAEYAKKIGGYIRVIPAGEIPEEGTKE